MIDPWWRRGGIQWSAGTSGQPRGCYPAGRQAKVGRSVPKAALPDTRRGVGLVAVV